MEQTMNLLNALINLIINFGTKLISWIDTLMSSWVAYSNKYSKYFVYALLLFIVLWAKSAKYKFAFEK